MEERDEETRFCLLILSIKESFVHFEHILWIGRNMEIVYTVSNVSEKKKNIKSIQSFGNTFCRFLSNI